tara:strand:+ start:85 stop:294 length:210 start_codon:yes stop_codon:yes gene_type:complete
MADQIATIFRADNGERAAGPLNRFDAVVRSELPVTAGLDGNAVSPFAVFPLDFRHVGFRRFTPDNEFAL